VTTTDPLAGLPRDTRRRLDSFTQNVERIGLDQLPMYAARPVDRDHRRTIEQAEAVASENGRAATVDAVRESVLEYVNQRFVDAQFRPTWAGLSWVSAGTVDDRARIAVSLGEAAIAVALWDLLDEGVRDEMLGAWAGLAG
jgi:hypothetical protein